MKKIIGDIKKTFPAIWILLAMLSVIIDYLSGPVYNFPVLVSIPIAFSTWHNGLVFGIIIGLFIMVGELYLLTQWHDSISCIILAIYMIVRLLIMFSFIVLIDTISRQKKEIRILKGFLPICSFCKKIRDDSGTWIEIESYIDARSEAKFSHSLCPECAKEHYGQFLKK